MTSCSKSTDKSMSLAGSSSGSSVTAIERTICKIDLDSDDEDFKPLKSREKKKAATKEKNDSEGKIGLVGRRLDDSREVTEIKSKPCNNKSVINTGAKTEIKHKELSYPKEKANLGNDRKQIPELEEIGNQDEVEFLCTSKGERVPPFTNTEGKSAWKSLMEHMQKNQKAKGMSSGSGPKNKPPPKRGLVLSPRSKGVSKAKSACSPLKKNPRLAVNYHPIALHDLDGESTDDAKESHSDLSEKIEAPDRKALAETNIASISTMSKDTVQEKRDKIAPVFLPPSERKALYFRQNTKADGPKAAVLSTEFSVSAHYKTTQSTLFENPEHFMGNVVVLNNDVIDKDPYGGTKTKKCPFYKILPDVPFCVDAFNYGLIPGMEVYFLSHFHSDHYIGLTKKFCKTIICSHPTGNLTRQKLYVEDKYIRKLNLNKPYIIRDVEVTLIDANHCPGSVMFIFRLKSGKVILHTGDFRFTEEMLSSPFVQDLKVDLLYLDTTYCSPEYDFPTQCESISNVVLQIKKHLEYRPKTLVLCGSYLIGKERVYFTVAEEIGSKVFAKHDKRKVINALENAKFSSLLSSDESTCRVHVVSMFSISAKNLQEYLAQHPQYTNIIGIKPSGWQFSSAGNGCSIKTHYGGTVTVIGVPYSEHSSFSELRKFVSTLRSKQVQPTVNVGNAKKREDMMRHIESWGASS